MDNAKEWGKSVCASKSLNLVEENNLYVAGSKVAGKH